MPATLPRPLARPYGHSTRVRPPGRDQAFLCHHARAAPVGLQALFNPRDSKTKTEKMFWGASPPEPSRASPTLPTAPHRQGGRGSALPPATPSPHYDNSQPTGPPLLPYEGGFGRSPTAETKPAKIVVVGGKNSCRWTPAFGNTSPTVAGPPSLDGFLAPSAVRPTVSNLVFFPDRLTIDDCKLRIECGL